MPIVPIHGCQHLNVRYERPAFGTVAERATCPSCGAVWIRRADDRWTCVDSGREPDLLTAYRCPSCGTGYREQPRTCMTCSRPTRNDEDQLELLIEEEPSDAG